MSEKPEIKLSETPFDFKQQQSAGKISNEDEISYHYSANSKLKPLHKKTEVPFCYLNATENSFLKEY